MNPPPAVLHTFIRLQRDARAGGLRDDGYELRDRQETSAISHFSFLVKVFVEQVVFCVVCEGHLLSCHESLFLSDVDVIDGQALFRSGLVSHAIVRSPHHTALTSGHLETHKHTHFKYCLRMKTAKIS